MLENPNYRTELITSKEAWSIRQPVLREGKPIEACIFDGDDFKTTFHTGLFVNDKLIAVATFMKNTNPRFLEKNQFQLRGMAVLKDFQGKGYGHDILKFGESILVKQGVKMIWCNARKIAVNFYERNHYTIKGDSFIIPDIGIHYVMSKTF